MSKGQRAVGVVALSLMQTDPLALSRWLVCGLSDHKVVHELLLLLKHHSMGVLVDAQLLSYDRLGISPE